VRSASVLKSTIVAAWLTGALALGRLANEYISTGSPPKSGPGLRMRTVAQGVAPSRPLPSEGAPEMLPIDSGVLGALAAVVLLVTTAVSSWPPPAAYRGAQIGLASTTVVQLERAPIAQHHGLDSESGLPELNARGLAQVTDAPMQVIETMAASAGPDASEAARSASSELHIAQTTRSTALPTQSRSNFEQAWKVFSPGPDVAYDVAAGMGAAGCFAAVAAQVQANRRQRTQGEKAKPAGVLKTEERAELRSFLLAAPPAKRSSRK